MEKRANQKESHCGGRLSSFVSSKFFLHNPSAKVVFMKNTNACAKVKDANEWSHYTYNNAVVLIINKGRFN